MQSSLLATKRLITLHYPINWLHPAPNAYSSAIDYQYLTGFVLGYTHTMFKNLTI
jgi:hypothetical protein